MWWGHRDCLAQAAADCDALFPDPQLILTHVIVAVIFPPQLSVTTTHDDSEIQSGQTFSLWDCVYDAALGCHGTDTVFVSGTFCRFTTGRAEFQISVRLFLMVDMVITASASFRRLVLLCRAPAMLTAIVLQSVMRLLP